MNLPDLLNYADITQLREIAVHHDLNVQTNSKHELIRVLLFSMQRPGWWQAKTGQMAKEELRFWQLLFLDTRDSFSLEELLGKGRQALGEHEGSPRTLVGKALKIGALFPSVSTRDRSLYQVPLDVRKHIVHELKKQMMAHIKSDEVPPMYRDEQNSLVQDLAYFLSYIGDQGVRLTTEGAIYKRDLQTILRQMAIPEEPVAKTRWRFGFGRRYHQYPDRFSLLYDYAFYRRYISENEGCLRLSVRLEGNKINNREEAAEIYHFWLRLYRRSIPLLPLIVKWIFLLSQSAWVNVHRLSDYLKEWLSPFYYMDEDAQFVLIVQMLTHLGILQVGQNKQGADIIRLTENGRVWGSYTVGWDLNELDEAHTRLDTNF